MARVLGLVLSVCLLTATVAGCGSGTTTASNPAEADCDDFVENFLCPTLIYCGATIYDGTADCANFYENGPMSQGDFLQCSTVTVEYSGLAHCESVVNHSYCSELVSGGVATLPPACMGVFN